MNDKRDNIYVYTWEEFNTVYVGRTVNPKSRHYQHRHIPTEKTYQFSSEHGVEHPKMIIIENDLTVEEGVEREKYWIDYYKEKSFNILNKTCGGQIGKLSNLSEEDKAERKKNYGKEYYNSHKEEIKNKRGNYFKEYWIANKEKIKKQREEYKSIEENYNSDKEKRKERNRKYRETHKEELKMKNKIYREMHKDEIKKKKKIYYIANKKIGVVEQLSKINKY